MFLLTPKCPFFDKGDCKKYKIFIIILVNRDSTNVPNIFPITYFKHSQQSNCCRLRNCRLKITAYVVSYKQLQNVVCTLNTGIGPTELELGCDYSTTCKSNSFNRRQGKYRLNRKPQVNFSLKIKYLLFIRYFSFVHWAP